MSILVLQIIIKQWDKSQRTAMHIEERAKIPDQYQILFPPAMYVFEKQCIIDQRGDDLLGNRLHYSQLHNGAIQLDRFQINMSKLSLHYQAQPDSSNESTLVGSIDNRWLQCKYDWRYGIDEGGFYYWLYEEVTLNAICVDILSEDIFMEYEPASIVKL